MLRSTALSSVALLAVLACPVLAQTTTETPTETDGGMDPVDVSTVDTGAMDTEDGLLTPAQLQTLVAPVALYPDSLLVQLLVASTYPLEVVKADRVVQHNADLAPEDLKAEIEVQEFDPSVEVLAVAFPTVLAGMAEHIEWTEITGNAMMAQSDDVMDAVQVMRKQAINTGALVDSPEQTVTVVEETDEDLDATLSTQGAAETVVIQPADPQQVYVPTYDPNAVYGSAYSSPYYAGSGFRWQDAAVGAAVVYGTVSLIDAIFDDDDDWNNYWGCGNCGGWNGQPIIRDPSIEIDGDVNIGNKVIVDRDKVKGKIETGDIDRDEIRNRIETGDIDRDKIQAGINSGDIKIDKDKLQNINRGEIDIETRKEMRKNLEDSGWKPDPDRQNEARDRITEHRGAEGATTLPAERRSDHGDDLRKQLSERTGTGDISRPENTDARRNAAIAAGAAGGAVAGREALKRTSERKDIPVNRPKTTQKPEARPQVKKPAAKSSGGARPAASKPVQRKAAPKPAAKKQVQRPTSGHSKPKIKKQAGGHKAKSASKRGNGAKLKSRR